jgi:hypothetical protein
MSYRWLLAAGAAVALLTAGCSSSPTPTNPTTASSAGTSAPSAAESTADSTSSSPTAAASAPADAGSCSDITGASLDLSAATNKDDARKAADTLEKYNPPASVKDAIEHFVGTGGLQFDDPDSKKYNDTVDNWVHQLCPLP